MANTCRGTGDADGLGHIRKKELVNSGLQLGIGSKDDILVVEDKYMDHKAFTKPS